MMDDSFFLHRIGRVAGGVFGLLAALALALTLSLILAPAAQAQGRMYWSTSVGTPMYADWDGGDWGGGDWGDGWDGGWGDDWGPGWNAWVYAPPLVVQAPPQRIQVQNLPLGPAPPSYWYYCSNPAGYYPQIATCPAGWAQVLAQPAPPAPTAPPAKR
ncbi:MAG: hypothetical protein ACYCUK_03065 [Thiomonas sp.]